MKSNLDVSNPRTARLLTVVAAVVAALVVWVIARLAGVEVRSPRFGDNASSSINAGFVIMVSALAGLAGWALLAILDRFTARSATVWTAIAVVVLLLSLAMPLSGSGVEGSVRLSLVLMHLAVGAVLIPGLSRTAQRNTAPAAGDGVKHGARR